MRQQSLSQKSIVKLRPLGKKIVHTDLHSSVILIQEQIEIERVTLGVLVLGGQEGSFENL